MRNWLSVIVLIVCAIGFSQNLFAQPTEYAFKNDLKAFSVNGAAGNTYVWKITLPDNSVQVLSSTASSSGNITFATTGTYLLWVQATDGYGCLSEPITKTIIARTEVTIVASTPTASENAGNNGQVTIDLGSVNTTGANVTITLTVSGTATPGADYTVLPLSVVIPDGLQTATIGVTGIVNDILVEGNETVIVTISGSDQVIFPIAANPANATATVTISDNDTAIMPTVGLLTTNDNTPLLSGTATINPGETLTVEINGVTYTAGDGKLTHSGTNWSLQIPGALPDNTYEVTVKVTGSSGLLATDNTTNELIVDTAPPVIPTVTSQTTDDTTPLITGTATLALGERLEVTLDGKTYTQGDGNLSVSGSSWSLLVPAANTVADGVYQVVAKVTDAAGNFSTDGTSNELTIKTNKTPIAVNDVFATSGADISGSLAINDSDPENGTLIYKTTPISAPTKGILTIQPNGSFTYVVLPTATGTDEFIYEVCDNGTPAACAQGRVVIEFNNLAPLAVNDNYIAEQSTVINGRMNLNDTDPNENELVYSTTPELAPLHGSVVIQEDGSFIYTPVTDYVGTDSFTYKVCDKGIPVQCSTAIVSLELTKLVPINRAPIAVSDINNTLTNTVISGNVLTNDFDPDGNELALNTTPVVLPAHGSVVILANGNYTYTPNSGYVGEDYFTYSVCEKNTSPVLCSEANVTIEVRELINAANGTPVANEDEVVVQAEKSILIAVLANDFDPDGNPIHISRIPTSVSHGTLVQNPSGTFTYTPETGFTGTDQFVYEICDDQLPALCSRATVSIQVVVPSLYNTAPFAADDAYFTPGTKVSGNLALNDSDLEGNKLVYSTTPVSAPAKGTVTISANGLFEYTPDASFEEGTDRFIYQVCDDGNPSACSKATVYITLIRNKKPELVDDLATTTMDKPVSGNLLANDIDPNGDQLILKLTPVSGPSNGTVLLKADGSYTYTPKTGFVGQDQITYEVCDNGNPPACAQGVLTIKVEKAVPVITDRIATNDVNITFKNTAVSGNVLTNDAGFYGYNSNVAMYSEPVNGLVNLAADGLYTYTPKNDYVGVDNFYYTVCTVENPADCDTVNVTIQVIPDVLSMSAPVAIDDEIKSLVNTAVKGNVLANDLSVSGEELILNMIPKVAPKYGTLVLNASGSFDYQPKAGFTGQDYYLYEICSSISGLCAQARVTITVSGDPIVRLFAADDAYFSEGKALQGNLLNNDLYPSLSNLTISNTPLIQASHGTVSISNGGIFNYTPTTGFVGTDQFVYEICDKQLALCDKATVYVVVKAAPVNTADLAIQKTGPSTVYPGDNIKYQLSVINHGTATATKIQISDFLPGAVQNPKFVVSGSTLSKDWSGYYELNELKINETFSLEISGTVSTSSPDTLKNVATVYGSEWDPKLDDNISVVRTVVSRGPVARIAGAPYLIVGNCDTNGRMLDAGSSKGDGLSFAWTPSIYLDNANSSKPVFIPGKTTRYKLTVSDIKGQQDTTSVLVVVAPAPVAITEKNVFVEAPNKTIMLSGSKSTGAGLSYLWLSKEGIILNGETTPTAQVSGLGMYYLQVTDSLGCSARDSVNVGLYIQAINDTTETKVNESVVINVLKNDQPANSINPSSISIVTPPLHGIATVDADSLILYLPEESYIGQDEFVYQVCDYFKKCDQAKVLVLINDVPFFIPEAFSPNGDGKNDTFEIKGLYKYKTVEIEIINRWGNTVYQSNNYGEGSGRAGFWDGTASTGLRIGSGPVPTGTYYYILRLNGKETINGSIYLDR